jgi:hypothetical protein
MIVNGWIASQNGDILKVLDSLDVEEYEETAQLIIKSVLPHFTLNFKFDIENLTPESALFWRVYLTFMKEQKVLPNL